MGKPKKVNFSVIKKPDAAYETLEQALYWHEDLDSAQIGLAWRRKTKEDVDGHIVLGRCHKVADLNKEFMPFDFVVVLNKEYWDAFSEEQRLALVDHELCHAAASLDEQTGDQKEDERGRKVWRIRKHDIEEFREIVERHGCYKSDLEQFAEAIRSKNKTPLLARAAD